jgi:methylglutaconyl-CoA hydratase
MSVLLLEDRNGIRTLTLNRPERRNALTPELIEALTAALVSAADSGVRAILLRGAGESFCAGLDITELQASAGKTEEEHREDAARIARLFRALYDCDLPTIAAVQGAAVAGGTGLATLCDFTLAAPGAKFGYTEARIGFVPALVSAYLALQIGDKQARGLLLSARLFVAEEAYRLGLVNEIVPAEELDARSFALAEDVLRNSPASLRATKQLLRAQQREFLEPALALGMDANAASRQTPDFLEGVTAFLEKRKPFWV